MKKIITAIIAFIITQTAVSAQGVTILLNNSPLAFPVEPFIAEGTTFVPMRVIFEALGASVSWNGATRTVSSKKGGTEINLTIGSTTVYKNGQSTTLAAAPVIVNDYTMVPLRFVSESMGCDVDWNGQTKTVTITTGGALENAVIGFVGDSICSGGNFEGGYAKILSEMSSITAINEAAGGAVLSRGIKWDENYPDLRPCITDMLNSLPDSLDYVIMQGGLNDFWGHAELGTADSDDTLTYGGALNALFKKAKADYPYSKLGFVITHDAFTYDAEENFEPYYELTKTICDQNGIPYLDLYAANNEKTGVNVKDAAMKKTYFESDERPGGDGVHPNETGYREIYAKPMLEWLKTL